MYSSGLVGKIHISLQPIAMNHGLESVVYHKRPIIKFNNYLK
jgi:hypothetical protein